MKRRKATSQSVTAIFMVPLFIGVLSSAALVVALAGDGWRDALSWVGLAVPVSTVAWAMRARRS